jgi:hypothetical protein
MHLARHTTDLMHSVQPGGTVKILFGEAKKIFLDLRKLLACQQSLVGFSCYSQSSEPSGYYVYHLL